MNFTMILALFFFFSPVISDCFAFSASAESKQSSTSNEKNIVASKNAVSFTTVGFGPASMRRFGDQLLAYNFYGGKFWSLGEFTGLGFVGEFTSDLESSYLIGTSITSSFFPFETDISPYTGAEIGFAFARGDGKNVFGFSMGGSVGVLFFRSSTVQLNVQLKANILLNKLPEGYPGCFQVRLGLLF